MNKIFTDRFGNELQIGDRICFTASNGNWRQTPELTRATITDFTTDKSNTDWIIITGCTEGAPTKVVSSRVVKCY